MYSTKKGHFDSLHCIAEDVLFQILGTFEQYIILVKSDNEKCHKEELAMVASPWRKCH